MVAGPVRSIRPSSSTTQSSGPSHMGSWASVQACTPLTHKAGVPATSTHAPGRPAAGSGQHIPVNGDLPPAKAL